MPQAFRAIRATRDRREASNWALVLASTGISSRVQRSEQDWWLVVAEDQVEAALEQIESYEHENPPAPPKPPPIPAYGRSYAGLLLGIALLLFFGISGDRSSEIAWFASGAADARAILNGEWWRAITALTLHADLPHVFANALSSLVFVSLVCYLLGPGCGGWLILGAGVAGNALNAWLRGAGHVSVGASTALFGAIGILCGLQATRRWRLRGARGGAWLPIAAGLALLAMLGTAGERTDVSAHLLGLVCGIPLGALAAIGLKGPPARPLQWAGIAGLILFLAAAWVWALHA